MVASIKLLTSERITKKGYPVVVEIFESNKLRPRKIIGHSFPEFWNNETNEPLKAHPDYYELLPIVKDYNARITRVNYGDYTLQEAQDFIFDSTDKKNNGAYFLEFVDRIIYERAAKKMATKNFKDVKRVLIAYLGEGKDILINDITYEWLNEFMLHKLSSGTNKGGIKTYFQSIKTVYKEAQKRESLKVKIGNPFSGLIKKSTPKPQRAHKITKDDLLKLRTFKPHKFTPHKATKDIYRNIDIWFFQFIMGGIDYLFLALLEWENIVGNRLVFNRNKNRDKSSFSVMVDNLLTVQALEVIYNHGNTDTKRIFSFIPHPYEQELEYQEFRNRVTRSLRTVCNHIEIPVVTTKSTRYIFRTFAGNKLIHDLVIMKLQGHKPEGVTFIYQGNLNKEIQDKYHLEIIDLSQ